ncbi:MAG: hypothetical protein CVU05_09890 [Bacteroidetes bacterium HGW-Bacteroidetes-21]|nr:MAG: hypothetical protein CVU05_09890 [Bacteroidetes bacterium HGW-Bacteroidetes-21]
MKAKAKDRIVLLFISFFVLDYSLERKVVRINVIPLLIYKDMKNLPTINYPYMARANAFRTLIKIKKTFVIAIV